MKPPDIRGYELLDDPPSSGTYAIGGVLENVQAAGVLVGRSSWWT
ncbi:MAG: hypothetical protein ACE37B_07035 [Ilumatobacter sp.]